MTPSESDRDNTARDVPPETVRLPILVMTKRPYPEGRARRTGAMTRRLPAVERHAIPAVEIALGMVEVGLPGTGGDDGRFDAKPVIAFFALAYAFSWAWVIPWAATGHTVFQGKGSSASWRSPVRQFQPAATSPASAVHPLASAS